MAHTSHKKNLTHSLNIPKHHISPTLIQKVLASLSHDVLSEGNSHFQDNNRTQRKTIQFGYDYFKLEAGDHSFVSPPPFLEELGLHIQQTFGAEEGPFTNYIISYYGPGYSLEPHADVDIGQSAGCRYYFKENVFGLILENDPTGHLYFVYDDSGTDTPSLDLPSIYNLEEAPGLAFCLTGAARKKPYFHGVSKVTNQRLSITFRHVALKE